MEEKKYYHHLIPQPPKIAYFAIALLGILFLVLGVKYAFETYTIYKSIKTNRQTITLSAEGKILTVPDLASIDVSVVTQNKDPKIVAQENTQKSNAIIDFLKSKGVAPKDIKTSNYSLSPQYYYPYDYPRLPCPFGVECPPKSPTIVNYQLNQTLQIKVRDFKIIGDILSGVVGQGANSIGDVQFSIEDTDKFKNQARKIAIINAKEKAMELAQTAGIKLGPVISFSETGNYPTYSFKQRGYSLKALSSDQSESPQIESGSQEIIVTMSVVFEIE